MPRTPRASSGSRTSGNFNPIRRDGSIGASTDRDQRSSRSVAIQAGDCRLQMRPDLSTVRAFVDPRGNHLLGALRPEVLNRWEKELEPVEMPLGQVLYEAGTPLTHVYFPTTAIVSLTYPLANGSSTEIAVGRSRLLNCSAYGMVRSS